jgi:hypothetical protein
LRQRVARLRAFQHQQGQQRGVAALQHMRRATGPQARVAQQHQPRCRYGAVGQR